MTANDSIALELMSLSALLGSDPARVRARARELLARAPDNRSLALLLASASLKLEDTGTAIATLEPWAQREPKSAVLRLELGRAYRAAGRVVEAVAALKEAVARDAALAEAWRELAALSFGTGDEAGGDAAYLRYSRLIRYPTELTAAMTALAEARFDAADQLLERRLAGSPGDAAAWRLRGEVALRRQRYTEAETSFRRCLGIAPGDAIARFGLASALHELNRSEEALPLLDRLLRTEPDQASYLELQAKALRAGLRNDDALALLRQAVATHPDGASLLLLYGHILREEGQVEHANEIYRKVTTLSPGAGTGWWCLANTKTYSFTDAELADMRHLLDSGRAEGADRVHLEFALGKALEDRSEYEESFRHYSMANTLHRGTFSYRALAVERTSERIRETFTAEFVERRRGWGSDRKDPIFIVGLPRSGSTLLEQVLASHSQVEGTHELAEIPAIAANLVFEQGSDGALTSNPLASLTAADVAAFADRYLERTRRYRRLQTPRFTDKQLGNFRNLALIHLMFPNAAIIDIRRHPMASGFACYKQHFSHLMPFCYDLGELAHYYRDYVRLMEHIEAVLPGRVHRVYYERLVADPEGEVRKLLDYCGLEFESACLQFHANKRAVRTISSEQVRRPIYKDSIEQWRHYEPWLGPLREGLGDLVDRYPKTAETPSG
ncbi:MAG TPA: sulfotransferase [Steroidobacteraceae bacterium]|nr:sulfotransferase [Steroidobacteraceae bacterium]